jgi:Protein of unknown function (DUF4242)
MKKYLVELYEPTARPAAVAAAAERAREAALEITREGTPVRYVRSLLIPEDQTCFHLFEGSSTESIDEASKRAALAYERIVEVVE